MCGIERDSSTFPKFKDERQWNEWYNKIKAQARSQFVDDIFDVNYIPGSVDDINLFDLKNTLMYTVFINTLLIDK